MDIKTFINDWIAAGNAFDTKRYLGFFLQDAIIDDRSIGRKFKGHPGIQDYFESYFIGYNTNTELVNLKIIDDQKASHLEVKFSGDFPEGKVGGSFDFEFSNGKISFVKADLIH